MAILNSPSSVPAKAGTHDDKALSESVVEKGKVVDDESDTNSELKQDGVKQVEAVTQAWSPAMMWLVFVLLYLVTFVDTLLQAVHSGLVAYVTSSFNQHGLLAVTSIFGSVVAGVGKLAIAKIIDIRGRCEGFLLMILFIVVGMILKALCKNVETYAAGHTFYWVGHIGLSYIVNVIISDMTSLRNRMIMWGLYMSPRLASTFGGPKIAELFYERSTYRWAFGSFCIILVGFSIPVAVVLISNERKAKAMGLLKKEKSGRTMRQSTIHYLIEFDVVGMLLILAGFGLILISLNIATRAPKGWASDYIIAMIVVGVVCLVMFGLWEKYLTKVPFIPYRFLKDRTIIGACCLSAFLNMSIFAWDTYYYSYLQVVHELSIAKAGYVLNAFSVTSTIIAPFIGWGLRAYGRYYWPAVSGIPFCILGTALLIYFRHPGVDVGYLVMCQVFHGICGGIWAMTGPLAIMASVDHQELAVVLAIYGMFGSIGQAVGFAVSGSIWTNDLPRELNEHLPVGSKNESMAIYGDITKQMEFPIGNPIRDGVVDAYGAVQREMVIAGCAFLPFVIVSVLVWRNLPIKERKQTKGTVF